MRRDKNGNYVGCYDWIVRFHDGREKMVRAEKVEQGWFWFRFIYNERALFTFRAKSVESVCFAERKEKWK